MTEEYKALMDAVAIEIRPEDVEKAKAWRKLGDFRRMMMLIMIGTAVLSFFTSIIVIVLVFVEYAFMQAKYSKPVRKLARVHEIFNDDCDPEGWLSYYMAVSAYMGYAKGTDWGAFFYNVFNGLAEAGRFEDARKAMAVFDQYYNDETDILEHEIMHMRLLFEEKDLEGLKAAQERLLKAKEEFGIRQGMDLACKDALCYVKMLELMNDGQYDEFYEYVEENYSAELSVKFYQVRQKFYLYLASVGLNDMPVAEELKAFVLNNGGTTVYKRKLEETVMIEKTPELPEAGVEEAKDQEE